MNFNLHFGELHSDNSINDKYNLFESYIPKCYKVKTILISFSCFSEYSIKLRSFLIPVWSLTLEETYDLKLTSSLYSLVHHHVFVKYLFVARF